MILRHYYGIKSNLHRVTDVFYWPAIDLILWGLTSSYWVSLTQNTSHVFLAIIAGLALWIIMYLSANTISLGVLTELWDRNLMNILASPVSFTEMIVSNMIVALVKSLISFSFTVLLAYVFYKIALAQFIIPLAPHIFLLTISGWWIAFLISGLVLNYGTQFETLAWTLVFAISPLSGVYYPISALPEGAQLVSRALPTSYIFESMREVIATGYIDYSKLGISFILSVIYITITGIFMYRSFKKAQVNGISGLY